MKFTILTAFTFLIAVLTSLSAQDVITKKDGSKIDAKILEISSTQIKYHLLEQPQGPLRSLETYEVKEILYENGTKETFNAKPPLYLSDSNGKIENNQNKAIPKYSRLDMMGSGFAFDFLIGLSQFKRKVYNYSINDFGNYIYTDDKNLVSNSFTIGARISNKFYFDATNKWRTGIQISYLRFNMTFGTYSNPIGSMFISPMHIGTANIFRINDHLGVEANLVSGLTMSDDNVSGRTITGVSINPEVKIRYKLLALGIDYSRTSQLINNPEHRLHQLSLSIGAKF